MCLLAIMFMIANTSAQTRVIAHRGFWKTQGSAQNSITSLLKADSIGCYGSEFDVWLTKDNGLVVSHDGIIQGHKVEESTLKELTGLWLANGECVPSLKELLETAKRKTSLKLVLELKAHSKPEREIKAVTRTPDDIYHLFVSRIKGTDPSGSHKHSCILSERGLISTTTERIG